MRINISQEDFGTLCICALRYCMGRQTYMPSLVQGICKAHLSELSDGSIDIIYEDCKDQKRMNLWGDERLDKPDWLRWHDAVAEERKRRKQ